MMRNLSKIIFCLYMLFVVSYPSFGQHVQLFKGIVTDETGQPQRNVAVMLEDSLSLFWKAETDSSGYFAFPAIPTGSRYRLSFSRNSYFSMDTTIMFKADKGSIYQFLLGGDATLAEVTVISNTMVNQLRNAPIKAEIIDVKKEAERPTTLADMMNRGSGIKVRQDGGLGSNANVYINGFQGNAIRLFKDGIPMEYLGGGINLGTFPVDLLDRVEVYKGVLPTSIGADALGAAINLVSRENNKTAVSASYEMASFNTHIFTFSLRNLHPEKAFFYSINGFVNYSDNDYIANVNAIDSITSNYYMTKAKMFHNRFRQYYVEANAGWKNTWWADELKFTIVSTANDRQVQYNAGFTLPYGAVLSRQRSHFIPSVLYKKSWLEGKMHLSQFLTYSKYQYQNVDTMYVRYDWFGNYTAQQPLGQKGGEASKGTFATTHYHNFISRTFLDWQLNNHNRLEWNTVYATYGSKGSDSWAVAAYGGGTDDYLKMPAVYRKITSALGWNVKAWEGKLENVFQIKYYHAFVKGQTYDESTGLSTDGLQQSNIGNLGVAEALKLSTSRYSFVRISVEKATRLPDQTEIFGFGSRFSLPNFSLKPEQSWNGNLGWKIEKPEDYTFEANAFYRYTTNMIQLRAIGPLFFQSQNIDQVTGVGTELMASKTFLKMYTISGNITYQDFRRKKVALASEASLIDSRVPNLPYFFSNVNAEARFKNVLIQGSFLTAYVYWSYTQQFYLNAVPKSLEPDGFLGLWGKSKVSINNVIPSQNTFSAGFLYHLPHMHVSIGGEVKNLFDKQLFDYYKIPRPGRNFHLKLNFDF